MLYDTVRGDYNKLNSNTTDAEVNNTSQLSFESDGFSLGNATKVNESSTTYVAWTWDAGSSTVSNTDGSITSSVRANPTAGFSIVTYTGNGVNTAQTIGHGLNAKPGLIIFKGRDQSFNWAVLHQSFTDRVGKLNLTDAFDTGYTSYGSGVLDPNGITSSTFSTYPGTFNSDFPNANGFDYVAYCFAPVEGYSAFGSYTGNGSSDGTFVYTGFRVRWLLRKLSSGSGESWRLIDTARSPINVAGERLLADSTVAEATQPNEIDILSNGFKLRSSDTAYNGSGSTYIYAAFAENPFALNARAR